MLVGLDGVRGCWDRDKLARRASGADQPPGPAQCGTVFFWGVSRSGGLAPLELVQDRSGGPVLRGSDEEGGLFASPYTPRAVLCGLHEGNLVPSPFTCFLALALARGVACLGGVLLCGCLPAMQRVAAGALREAAGNGEAADLVLRTPAAGYLSGMAAVMTRKDRGLVPAGPVEIMAGGGIVPHNVERMLRLTVREAHLAGLLETAPHAVPAALRASGWRKGLAADCARLLADRVVIK